MTTNEHIHKLAEISGKPDSKAMRKFLEGVTTDDEARFMLEMPATTAVLTQLRSGHFQRRRDAQ